MSGQRSRLVVWFGIVALAVAATACSELLNPFKPSSTTSNSGSTSTTTSSAFAITTATVVVDNSALNVTCPGNVTFTATLTSNKDGVIAYKWERSDGSATATQTLTFPSATSLTAVNTWQVPATTSAWQLLHVVTPNDISSNPVNFTVTCK
ncbi:MAG: hypothetical protein NT151_10365 [Acidobacteria bacterium]|nr:hypothetical protein [Acidobacteriota bacterium]